MGIVSKSGLEKFFVLQKLFPFTVTHKVYIYFNWTHTLFIWWSKINSIYSILSFCFLSIYFIGYVHFRLLLHSFIHWSVRLVRSSIEFGVENCNRMGFHKTLAGNHIDIVDCWGGWCCGAISFTCFKWSVSFTSQYNNNSNNNTRNSIIINIKITSTIRLRFMHNHKIIQSCFLSSNTLSSALTAARAGPKHNSNVL